MDYQSVFVNLGIAEEVFNKIVFSNRETSDTVFSMLVSCLDAEDKELAVTASFLVQYMAEHEENVDGGPGSGNFGHAGRPGEVGGSEPGKYSKVSDEARKIIEENEKNPYHFGETDEQKAETGRRLAAELKKSEIDVDYDEGNYPWPYKVISPELSYEENEGVNKALNQMYYSGPGFSKEDYIQKCRETGTEPKLSMEPKEVVKEHFYTKAGKLQHDGTPVYNSLSKEEVLSDKEINMYSGFDRELNPEGADAAEHSAEKAIDSLSDEQRSALNAYSRQHSSTNYSAINHYLTTGEGDENVRRAAEHVSAALDHEIGVDCITRRGDSAVHGIGNDDAINKLVAQIGKGNFSKAGKLKELLEGKTVTNDAVMSTSPGEATEGFGSLAVQYVFKTPKNAKAVDITSLSAYGGGRSEAEKALANTGLFGTATEESEVAFKPGTRYKIDRVEFSTNPNSKKKNGQVFLVCTILTDENDSREDEEPASWITLENGEHVPLDAGGKAIGGAGGWAAGKDFSTAKGGKGTAKGVTAKELNDKVQDAFADTITKQEKNFKELLDKVPVGGTVSGNGGLYKKTGKNKWEYEFDGEKIEGTNGDVLDFITFACDRSTPPVFGVPDETRKEKGKGTAKRTKSSDPENEQTENHYTGKLEFEHGKVPSQEAMDRKLQELNRNRGENEKPITSARLEKMAESVIAYGEGDECFKMLSTQSPEFYRDYLRISPISKKEKKEYAAKAKELDDFLRLSDKYEEPVYRALSFISDTPEHEKAAADFIKTLKPGMEMDMGHISSWAKRRGTAEAYANQPLDFLADEEGIESHSVVYTLKKPKSVVDIGSIKPAEGEALSPSTMKTRILSVKKSYDEETMHYRYEVELEEI